MNEIIKKTATQLVKDIKSRKISSEEVVTAFLEQIDRVNPILNAVVQQKKEHALRHARRADKKTMRGERLGKLHGIPITVKDFCDVKRYTCTYGSEGYKNNISSTNAFCIEKILNEGAIIIGMTNSPEFAHAYETSNAIYGQTNNPYDLTRTPGGSSGGEGAIIAASGSPLGIGSDGGGSIRLPSHFCGIAGIKPTQGLVSLSGISCPFSGVGLLNPHGTFGPMARYVEDLKLTLPILAHYNDKDPTSLPIPLNTFKYKKNKKLRIALYTDNGITKVTDEIKMAIQKSAKYLESQGHFVEYVTPPKIEQTFEIFWKVYFLKGDQGHSMRKNLQKAKTKNVSILMNKFINSSRNTSFTLNDLYDYISDIANFRVHMLEFMEKYDILLCPPCATPAKYHNTSFEDIEDFTYTMTYNLLGWPAGVVRCGTTKEGLPIGCQIVGKPWNDNLVLDILEKLEKGMGGYSYPKHLLRN